MNFQELSNQEIKELLGSNPKHIKLNDFNDSSEGRCEIEIGSESHSVNLDTFIFPSKEKKLFIFLSSVGAYKSSVVFHRVYWSRVFDGISILIDDPTRKMKKWSPGYYFGDRQLDVTESINCLIQKIKETFELENKDICFIASSNAGFTAIRLAIMNDGSNCLALCPVLNIKTRDFAREFEKVFNISLEDKKYRDRVNILDLLTSTKHKSKIFIYSNIASRIDSDQMKQLFSIKSLPLKEGYYDLQEENKFILVMSLQGGNPHLIQPNEYFCRGVYDIIRNPHSSAEIRSSAIKALSLEFKARIEAENEINKLKDKLDNKQIELLKSKSKTDLNQSSRKNELLNIGYIKDNTFFISSDQELKEVKDRLFGHKIEYGSNSDFGRGYYFSVSKDVINKKITIETDDSGMGMIFECRTKDFFAYSNSFLRLVEEVKHRVSLTINKDFEDLYTNVHDITTLAYKRTIFNEISILPSSVIVNIDLITKGCFYTYKRKNDYTTFGSIESFDYIKRWANKWINIIKVLVRDAKHINLTLSGGFDSRLVLALFIASGVNLKYINISSSERMKEDFEIACSIANHYKFVINNGIIKDYEKYTLSNKNKRFMNAFYRFGLHKQFFPESHYIHYKDPLFVFTGYGNMRGWFNASHKSYINRVISKKIETVNKDIKDNISRILNSSFNELFYDNDKQIPLGGNFINYAYNFTRGRYNYGSGVMAMASVNQFVCAPILDLEKIKPISEINKDYNLLFAYIYAILAPDLLKFKFSDNRLINPKTVNFALDLAKKYPFEFIPDDSKLKIDYQDNPYGMYMAERNFGEVDSPRENLEGFINYFCEIDEYRTRHDKNYLYHIMHNLSNKGSEVDALGLLLSIYADDATSDKLLNYFFI